jgi:hypothetical protein
MRMDSEDCGLSTCQAHNIQGDVSLSDVVVCRSWRGHRAGVRPGAPAC